MIGSIPSGFPFVNPLTHVYVADTKIWGTIPSSAVANTDLLYVYLLFASPFSLL